MRKRIYRISEDKFDESKPNIDFSQVEIYEECEANKAFEGSFSFKSVNSVPARGVVYCSNPYVRLLDPQFDGEIINIEYAVNDIYAKAGEVIKGEFTVVTVGLEQVIPFTIKYVNKELSTSFGEIRSLSDFAEKAQSRFLEAVNIFYSQDFENFIMGQDKEVRLLYRGFKGAPVSPVNVDEFLVACHLKDTMSFSVPDRTDTYYGVKENVRGEIEIIRNTWGYIDIEVSCDADFVSVEKQHITADFFLGSVFNMNYYVHREKMHAGINYAKISFDYRNIHREVVIMATAEKQGVEPILPAHDRRMNLLKLCRDYESFRLRTLSTGQWCKNTLEILDSNETDFSENMVLLFKALVYITNKQRQEALWIIQDLKRTIENKTSTEWAFLLYLCTLIEREESYVDKLTEDIEYIYREHSDDTIIFWFLLHLRKEYIKNPTAKLRAIGQIIDSGIESPFLFVEAYFVYLQDPYLIAGFDEFTIKILNWAVKKHAITRDVAIQMLHVLESQRTFIPEAVPVLEACYDEYPDQQFLVAMVTYMLKAETSDKSYFKWFKLAVESNLKIPGIFEAYMLSIDTQSVERLPQLVTMFFRYNNDLPYERKALLYANIILHKNEDEETFKQYERTIEEFSVDQLKLGRIDDNLAICYHQLLETGLIDKEIARLISNFIFKKKVAVLYPDIRRVILYQDEFKSPTMAAVRDRQAYLQYTGTEGALFLEDVNGHLIADKNGYFLEDILDSMGHLGRIRELCPQSLAFILNDMAQNEGPVEFTKADEASVELFLHSPQISNQFRISMYPMLIDYLCRENKEDVLEQHFMKEAELESLPAEVLAEIVNVFVIRSKYEEAYHLMQHTNCSLVKLDVATRVCQFMVNKKGEEIDDFLITLDAYLISKDMIHGDMLRYLIHNYVGPTDLMMKIYHHGFEKNIDVSIFAERILTQSIYRDFLPEGIMDVFDSYMNRKTNMMIVEAFLTFEAYEYVSKNHEIDEKVFAYIFNRIKREMKVNESMRIALLKYLCLATSLEDDELDMLDILLGDAIIRNQYFGFYSRCDKRLQLKYHLYDKHFVEFKCDRRKAVVITYSVNGNPALEEDMIEMYDGLYVKEFVLFFGDELSYEIYCDELSDEPIEKGNFVNSDSFDDSVEGRYAMMNAICRHRICRDSDELLEAMKKYQGLDSVTKELFKII